MRRVRAWLVFFGLGNSVLVGCGRESHDEPTCNGDGRCTPSGGHTTTSGGAGNAATFGGTGGKAAAGGVGGGSGNHTGGLSSFGGTASTSGGASGDGGTDAMGGATDIEAGSFSGGADGKPKVCPDGAFDHDGDPSNICKAWSRCTPGQYIAKEGTDTADRVCAICGTGTFSTTQNVRACSPWTDCATNAYVTQPGSTTSNQRCGACPSVNQPAPGSQCLPAGACLFSGGCDPGTVQIAPASGAARAECEACDSGDYCAGGLTPQVRCDNGTWDHDADPATCCSPWSTCAAGTSVSRTGSATADRECRSCVSGSFSQYPNAAECTPWTQCAPASSAWPQGGVATAGTATSDAVCADPYYGFGSADSDGALAVAVDGNGNVFVVGTTYGALEGASAGAGDAFVRKLDARGAILWTRQFGSSSEDQAQGVAVDGSGNVYVAGTTYGAIEGANGGQGDAFVRKLDASGATLWTRQIATSRSESSGALAVDGKGNAYVAGTSYGGSQTSGEAFVSKLDASGAVAWTQRFGGPDEDEAQAVAVDGSGNVYVGGYTYGGLVPAEDRGQHDAFVRKFDSSGATVWTRQFGTAEHEGISAARVDSDGNLYVAGTAFGALEPSEGSADAFVRKYDASGATIWTRQLGTASYDYGAALGIDGDDNLYVVGSTDGAFGSSSAGQSDIYVRKLDASGATQWTKQIGTASNDSAQGAAADATGNVYIVGSAGDNLNPDAFVLHVPAQSP